MIISAVDAAHTVSGTYGRKRKKKETEPEYSWNTMDVATGE